MYEEFFFVFRANYRRIQLVIVKHTPVNFMSIVHYIFLNNRECRKECHRRVRE